MSVPGGVAVFSCAKGQQISGVQWLVNDTALQDLNLRNVSASFSDRLHMGILQFSDLPLEYNMTRIKCSVSTSNSEVIESERDVLLLIQGGIGFY